MKKNELPFKIALNASTIKNFGLDIKEQIKIAAECGYDGIELWISDICEYLDRGGSTVELRKYIENLGIKVVNGIVFFNWSDADPQLRREGLEQAKKEMRILKEIGCDAVAAPPIGNVKDLSLDEIARNYYELWKEGSEIGVLPYLEIWGMAKKLSTLSEAAYIALQSGVPDAKILVDIYHLYKGGSSHDGIRLLSGESIGIVHINDYPSMPPRDTIMDGDRIFPGEGIAPVGKFLKDLEDIGYKGYLSLELFRNDYDGKDAYNVARYGYEKMLSLF